MAASGVGDSALPRTPKGDITVEVFARSDVGRVRDRNEDAFLVADLTAGARDLAPAVRRHVSGDKGSLFAVCDGMGGAAAGDVASALAIEVLFQEMSAAPSPLGDWAMLARLLRRAVRATNQRLLAASLADRRLKGMGTTLSAAVLLRDRLVLAQIGDSRAYLFRSGALVQLTRDQSIVSALVQAGRLTPKEAAVYPQQSVILQALGVCEDVEVSLSLADVRRGDLLLLCSDGLHGPVGDDGLRAVLSSAAALEAACHELIARALARGAPDNATVVLARFGGEGLRQPRGPEDLPHFVEFDPAEDGERSITTTSRVTRRLAARAGVGPDPGPPALPPTGQHRALSGQSAALPSRQDAALSPPPGPATARIAARSRLGPLAIILVGLAVAATLAALLFLAWRR